MKTTLRWVAMPIAFLILSSLFMLLSAIYFGWLLPLNSSKDWIIFFLVIPLSALVFFSQSMAAVISIALLSDSHMKAGYIVIIIIVSLYLIGAYLTHGIPVNFQQQLNCLQALAALPWLAYAYIKG
jgi:hypothetical protein